MVGSLRRLLLGRPLATARAAHERLDNWIALPIFSSDAISSSAYATEAILLALLVEGGSVSALRASIPIAIGIGILIAIVALSYTQTVLAYPTGGGSYIVGKENLGMPAAMVAGASLSVDYVLTVAVSVAAGVQAITSGIEALRPHAVLLSVIVILLITLANLRGLRESGRLFAAPTYAFMTALLMTIGWGLVKVSMGEVPPPPAGAAEPVRVTGLLWVWVLMRAYASGCTALTGIEAISNGVQAFRPPEGLNAAKTMGAMATILLVLFGGITYLANALHIVPDVTGGGHGVGETVVSQIAATVYGGKNGFYWFVQGTTMLILLLAANTSFAGFPRLWAILSQDRLMPRQFGNIGDKLVYNNGIIILAGLSIGLIVLFGGNVHGLLPLYAVGVFLSFTISQFGMVRRWLRLRTPRWQFSAAANLIGGITTLIVLLVLAAAKFMPPEANVLFYVGHTPIRSGAWLVILIIPLMVGMFIKINRHYRAVAAQLTLIGYEPPPPPTNTVIVLVPSVNRGTVPALLYAKSLGQDTRAVHIEMDPETTPRLIREWEPYSQGIPLLVLESPYRSLVEPLFRYLDEVQTEREHIVTIILPEFVPTKWWHAFLHNQSGLLLKLALLGRKDVIVTNMRYHLKE